MKPKSRNVIETQGRTRNLNTLDSEPRCPWKPYFCPAAVSSLRRGRACMLESSCLESWLPPLPCLSLLPLPSFRFPGKGLIGPARVRCLFLDQSAILRVGSCYRNMAAPSGTIWMEWGKGQGMNPRKGVRVRSPSAPRALSRHWRCGSEHYSVPALRARRSPGQALSRDHQAAEESPDSSPGIMPRCTLRALYTPPPWAPRLCPHT